MAKIVINKCYGGFSLSVLAIIEYGKRKGIDNLKFRKFASGGDKLLTADEALKAHNEWLTCDEIYDREISRSDPDLVAVVEQLGSAADGKFADLKVVEIPDGMNWMIEEYDGSEWVSEEHETWG